MKIGFACAWAAAALACFAQTPVFRAEIRLVEVYATVYDPHGRAMDGIARDEFRLFDNGKPEPIAAFESETAELSCALLLDNTGSMQGALPAVKNAVVEMLSELRLKDSVAVYGFSTTLNLLQDFTDDKDRAKRAVLRARAGGETALFDSLTQVAHDVSARSGKKAVIVFTDGADNASALNMTSAMKRVQAAGVPVYTIAEGDALKSDDLLKRLREIAQRSGAAFYEAHHSQDIARIFGDISADLKHGYLLAYKAPEGSPDEWHTIRVEVAGVKNYRVRAKEGYFPE